MLHCSFLSSFLISQDRNAGIEMSYFEAQLNSLRVLQMVPYKIVKGDNGDAWVEVRVSPADISLLVLYLSNNWSIHRFLLLKQIWVLTPGRWEEVLSEPDCSVHPDKDEGDRRCFHLRMRFRFPQLRRSGSDMSLVMSI